jgi:alkanesulfonate monooxygenase SsuD/methylene tetrahydromethanopterin reductase-like flavin-dependent oxidoreductase (luciferase family)
VERPLKQLHLGLFDNAQSNDTGTALWRHPDNQRVNFDSLDYWTEIAGICEEAKFDFLFLADAWGWADVAGKRPTCARSKASSFRGSTPLSWYRPWYRRPRIWGW